ncbi:metal ABC transporter permease [Vibrio vulnificus]|nr:zinc ABC transporter permease [Vibrio vulnificus]
MSEHIWLMTPVAIGLLALVSNIILGRQVLRRGVVFIDLAMAQISALAMIIVELYAGFEASLLSKVLASYLLTLPVAGLLSYLEYRATPHLEAMIGLLYVIAACVSINVVSVQAHGKELIDSLLGGRLLWTDITDVGLVLMVTLSLLWVQWLRSHWLEGAKFYLLFALAVPPLVINLGVYLEFAALILPALFALLFRNSLYWWAAISLGIVGGSAGFLMSLWGDYPVGPSIVLTMAGVGAVGVMVNLASLYFQRADSRPLSS